MIYEGDQIVVGESMPLKNHTNYLNYFSQ